MTPRAIRNPFPALISFAALGLADAAPGQCATQWLPGPALAGCDNGGIGAIVEWDPDGVGPRTPVAVIGGGFTTAGNVPANRIAAYDPVTGTWSQLGTGMDGSVVALAVLQSGDLVAGGYFTTAGGVPANYIARWDGVAWSPLGSGFDDNVAELVVMPNGDLVASGLFTTAGGTPVNRIASWNGIGWSSLGAGPAAGAFNVPFALAVLPNGELVAGGLFPPTRWNGSTWSPLGTGLSGAVRGLAAMPNGHLVAGGTLNLNGVYIGGVARWNGTTWAQAGTLGSWFVDDLDTLPNGDVIGLGEDAVRRFNGTSWSTIGTHVGLERAFAAAQLSNGPLLVGGTFTEISGAVVANVAAWNGATWSQLGPNVESPVESSSAAELANGDIAVAALFFGPSPPFSVNPTPRYRVVSWNGSAWAQLGGDFDLGVRSVTTASNGDLVAGGEFAAVGGTAAARVARWNGSAWQALGSGVGIGRVNTVLALPNAVLVAGGSFLTAGGAPASGVAVWNGTAWAPLGVPLFAETFSLVAAPNGDLFAGGSSLNAAVARWDGTAWSPVGPLTGDVLALAMLPNGDLVAGGRSLSAPGMQTNRVARWDGTQWLPLGTGLNISPGYVAECRGLSVLPNGDLVACGAFELAGGAPARGAARWNGSTWSPLATMSTGWPTSIARMANGDVVVTGVYRMDEAVSVGFARLTTTCPATANPSSAGCAGNTLAAASLPWIGSTFTALANGLPATAIAIDVLGVSTTSIALPLLLPQGVAGCSLAVTPDVVAALPASAGTATTVLPIPNTAALTGIVLHEQVLALGLGTGGAIATVTGTNRLTLTIGTF